MASLDSSDLLQTILSLLSQNPAELLIQVESLRATLPKPPVLPTPYQAAVVILLNQKDNDIILIKRPESMQVHPGQISFPGGRFEESDSSLEQTALRETFEEIGVPEDSIQILTHLGTWPTVSGYLVTPYVGLIRQYEPEKHLINLDEVESIIRLPVPHLLNIQNHYIKFIQTPYGPHEIYGIKYQEQDIWGLTGLVLGVLARLCLDP
jgi:8-oxo-dGTP pyrophosphatase MutT (NUDIX family)